MEGYVKQIGLSIPAKQYEVLKEIGKKHALSVPRLIKKGILLVINEYYENGCIGEEVKKDEINKEKEDDDWNDSQEPSES